MAHHKDGLAEKLIRFYRDNPDEWLSIEDAAAKFGVSRRQVMLVLGELTGKLGLFIRPTKGVML